MLKGIRPDQRTLLLSAAFTRLIRQWRAPVGVSLIASAALLAVVILASTIIGTQASASPLTQDPASLLLTWQGGPGTLCSSDPLYDPEMGCVTVQRSGPMEDHRYSWNRWGDYQNQHDIWTTPAGLWVFNLHRSKG